MHFWGFGFGLVGIIYLGFWGLVIYTLISVARWANQSRRNAEAYYKTASVGKIVDESNAAAAIELLREQERIANSRRRQQYKAGAFVNIAVGLALMFFLLSLPSQGAHHAFLVGLIPFLIGVSLLALSGLSASGRA